MPGARRSLASPVVSGVLCPCGSPRAAAAAPGPGSVTDGGGGSGPGSAAGPCGRALCEASEQERRLRALFQKLDVNRDGALCIHDLAVGLGRLGLHRTELDLLRASLLVALRERQRGNVLRGLELLRPRGALPGCRCCCRSPHPSGLLLGPLLPLLPCRKWLGRAMELVVVLQSTPCSSIEVSSC